MNRFFVFIVLLATSSVSAVEPPTWPQWRGPKRDGQVAGPPWSDTLGEKALQQVWRVELGPGYPGPVVAADRVFVVETRDRKEEVVRALDRATGKELWQASWTGAMTVPFFAASNGLWIRSTPAYDGESLFVAGMRDVLVCLDAGTGKERWRVDFVEKYQTPLPAFGFVASPLVEGDAVYVQAAASFVKLNKKTGEVLWRVLEEKGAMMDSAFSSPYLTTLAGKTQMLVQTRSKLAGVDPVTGGVLWSQPVPSFRGMNILTPTVIGDGIFTSTYSNKSFFYEVTGSADADKFTVKEGWTAKAQGYMSSPVVIDGHAYLHLQNQRFTCLDLKTGKEKWTTEEKFGKYWSLVANKDRILALDEKGELLLIKANPEKFELLDRRKVSKDETWGHLAVAGDEVFVRELKAITAFRWKR